MSYQSGKTTSVEALHKKQKGSVNSVEPFETLEVYYQDSIGRM